MKLRPMLAATLLLATSGIGPVSADPVDVIEVTLTGSGIFHPDTPYVIRGVVSVRATGTGLPYQNVDILLDGQRWGSVTSAQDGSFGASVPLAYPPELHELQASALPGGPLDTRSNVVRPVADTRVSTVTLTGDGAGRIVSTPPGIDCPDDCSAIFLRGQVVTLTASSAPGSGLTAWGPPCSGAGPTCTVRMTDDISVQTSFKTLGTNVGGPAVAFQTDAAHSGEQPDGNLVAPLARLWSRDLPGTISYPLIADGRVFVMVAEPGSVTPRLYAFDARTGATLWGPIGLGSRYWSGFALEGSRLFVLNAAGLLQAFDTADGAPLWATILIGQSSFTSAPTAFDGFVYTAGSGSGGTLYAVDATTGSTLWTQPVINGGNSSPAVSEAGVFVSYACGNTYRFDRLTGALLWHFAPGCSGGGGRTPALRDGTLFARHSSTSAVRFNATTGAVIGGFDAEVAPAFDGSGIYALSNDILTASTLSGAFRWSFSGDGGLRSAPVVAGGTVYLGSTSGNLYALNTSDGSVIWSDDAGSTYASPDEHNAKQLAGLAIGEGLLVAPSGSRLLVYR